LGGFAGVFRSDRTQKKKKWERKAYKNSSENNPGVGNVEEKKGVKQKRKGRKLIRINGGDRVVGRFCLTLGKIRRIGGEKGHMHLTY